MTQIAIDGPASAGKSTVAKIIANKLSYVYIDTGAMYRACTLIAREHHLDYGDEEGILKQVENSKIELKSEDGQQKVYIDGKDVSAEIRTPDITANVSQVSALPKIRKAMVNLQRKLAGSTNVVMDGRDIGTTVLPKAQVKIFLIASVESRAKRRLLDYEAQGIHENLADLEKSIAERDYKDSHREVSPLKKAADAVEVDTTNMTIEEVVNQILKIVEEKTKK